MNLKIYLNNIHINIIIHVIKKLINERKAAALPKSFTFFESICCSLEIRSIVVSKAVLIISTINTKNRLLTIIARSKLLTSKTNKAETHTIKSSNSCLNATSDIKADFIPSQE